MKENDWIPFTPENYEKYNVLAKTNTMLLKFDNGFECQYTDEFPFAICTHFKKK